MRIAIIGLPQSGKSTVFNALTGSTPDYTPGTRTAVVRVPDERLEALSGLYHPDKTTPVAISFGDLDGWERGFSPELVNELDGWDGYLLVARGFDRAGEPAEPEKDIEKVQAELLLSDLARAEAWQDRIEQDRGLAARSKDELARESKLVSAVLDCLAREVPLRECDLPSEEALRGHGLLTLKPLVTAGNLGEGDVQGDGLSLYGQLEAELAQLPAAEAEEFRTEFGLEGAGTTDLLDHVLEAMGQVRFYTVSGPEVRAWTLPEGGTALDAAGTIHTDMERGFIRAEVIPWDVLIELGGLSQARTAGKLRVEGKEYPMVDGDVVQIRFNV